MKVRNVFVGAALVVVTAAVTTQVVSQSNKDGGMPQLTPEQQADMQKCIEAGTPGENHAILKRKVGRWNGVVKHWMEPGSQPMSSNCTAEIKSLWNDRYFTEEIEGEGMAPGETFFGKSVVGYDNVTKKFFWVWLDNMSTSVMPAEGTYDAASKTFKYTFEMSDPRAGKVVKGRSVEKWVSNDQLVSEMWGPDRNGKEYKWMEITFNRAK